MGTKKYSEELKLKVVKYCLTGNKSVSEAIDYFGITRSVIRRWILDYHLRGIEGLRSKDCNKRYDPAFKLNAINMLLKEGLSVEELGRRLNISQGMSIRRWLHSYKTGKIKALPPEKADMKAPSLPVIANPLKFKTRKGIPRDTLFANAMLAVSGIRSKHNDYKDSADKAAAVEELKKFYPLKVLFALLEINARTFYYQRAIKTKPDKYAQIKDEILKIHAESGGTYGYRRITLALHNSGKTINHKTVPKLMQELGIRGVINRRSRYSSYKGKIGKVATNILQRNFTAK